MKDKPTKENSSAHLSLSEPGEFNKRRREIAIILALTLLFLVLTWVEFRLFETAKSLPFVHSVFFFGLVNFNIIILLLLIFMIFRNIVKVFTERRDGIFGGTLKSKLIAAFVSFSFVPTLLMFLISVFYINNSFDKWFSEKMAGVLKSSLEVTNEYYTNAKKRNYHFAHIIQDQLKSESKPENYLSIIDKLRENFRLDVVEYYPDIFATRYISTSTEDSLPVIPEVSLEFKQKGVTRELEASTIHHFNRGNLVRVIVPVQGGKGAVVVSSYIPLSLISKIEDISSAYQDFRNLNPIEYPIKSIYLIILVLITLVILLGATWFGFYMARQLSIPLQALGEASRDVARGRYRQVDMLSGSDEIVELIANFNFMTRALEASEGEIKQANFTLRKTLSQLDEHSRYIEVVLANVSTGVISVDQDGKIAMINRHAEKLLNIDGANLVGCKAKEVLAEEYYDVFDKMLKSVQENEAQRIQKEVSINVYGRPIPIQMTLTVLRDEKYREIGKVFVFDDLSNVVKAQRAAAWTEVARRIAHEIKNPLTPIKLAAQRLRKKFGNSIQDKAFNDCTNMIIEQVDDLKLLVNEFSNYARLPQLNPTIGSMNKAIEGALLLFKLSDKKIDLQLDLDPSLPEFLFDPDLIKRVLTNLVDNAISAIEKEDNPRVEVKTKFFPLTNIVGISIEDNGDGIPPSIMDRIFEPYVTTKESGTGLGLAIVKRTIEDHSGIIRALNCYPKGTKMLIELPVMTDQTYAGIVKKQHMSSEGQI